MRDSMFRRCTDIVSPKSKFERRLFKILDPTINFLLLYVLFWPISLPSTFILVVGLAIVF